MSTAVGCLPSAIDDEPVVNIFGLLEYWIDEPPAHVILAARYLGEHKKSTKKSAAPAAQSEDEFGHNMVAAGGLLGMAPQPVSQRTRELAAYAAEQIARMQKGKKANGQ